MPQPLATRAPAKINLTLHVLGRRADGYHELESLVAFAGTGDDLRLEPGPALSRRSRGRRRRLRGGSDNLVLKAARLLVERVEGLKVGTFHPDQAPAGGRRDRRRIFGCRRGLRLLARLNRLPLSHPGMREAARLTGADVPVCLEPTARMMRGVGEALGPALNLPRLFAVLVNPRVPVETPAVFRTLNLQPGQKLFDVAHPMHRDAVRATAARGAEGRPQRSRAACAHVAAADRRSPRSARANGWLPPGAHVGLGRDGVRALRRLHGRRRGGKAGPTRAAGLVGEGDEPSVEAFL